jgi:hypothetical protein
MRLISTDTINLHAEEVACRARRLLKAADLQAVLKLPAFTLNFGVAESYKLH